MYDQLLDSDNNNKFKYFSVIVLVTALRLQVRVEQSSFNCLVGKKLVDIISENAPKFDSQIWENTQSQLQVSFILRSWFPYPYPGSLIFTQSVN